MKTYMDCWTQVAADLFAQALAGEPELVESLPKPLRSGSFGFAATLSGDEEGRFAVVLDASILDSPLVGEGMDQKAGWGELLREMVDAAAGELLAKNGHQVPGGEIRGERRGEQGLARLPVEVRRARLDDSGPGRGARAQAGGSSRFRQAGSICTSIRTGARAASGPESGT